MAIQLEGQIANRYYNPAGRDVSGNLSGILDSLSSRKTMQMKRDIVSEEQAKEALVEDFSQVHSLLKSGEIEQALSVVDDRLSVGESLGRDMAHTLDLRQRIMTNPESAIKGLESVLSRAAATGNYKQSGSAKTYQPVLMQGPDGKKGYYVPTIMPDGSTSYNPLETPEGNTLVVETPLEKSQREIMEAASKREQEEQVTRGANVINFGYDAARGIPVLRRGISLLNSVQTGGWRKAAIRAKQVFGVESANEGELASNLGKAVLSQLRQTFGAQFTEREGARLEGIEAGLGKSAATNVRLLKQALSLSERYVKDAIKRAEKAGDEQTVAELEAWLDADLGAMMEQVTAGGGGETPQERPQGASKYTIIEVN